MAKAEKEIDQFLGKSDELVGSLEEKGYIPSDEDLEGTEGDPKASRLREEYRALYREFLQAHEENRAVEALDLLKRLREKKKRLERLRREAKAG